MRRMKVAFTWWRRVCVWRVLKCVFTRASKIPCIMDGGSWRSEARWLGYWISVMWIVWSRGKSLTVSVTPVFLLFSGLKLLVFAAFCLNSEWFAEYPLMLHLRAVGAVENEPIQRLIGDDLIRSRSTFYAVLINILYYIVWCTIFVVVK